MVIINSILYMRKLRIRHSVPERTEQRNCKTECLVPYYSLGGQDRSL